MQRFHNEARAAASLDHPHIVHVHAVGQERGVHYYAMQFIDGQTLAQLVGRQRGGAVADTVDLTHAPSAPSAPPSPAAETAPGRAADTAPAPRGAAEYRRVAEWVAQAAEALEHAHALGVVHRDVKPANLMIDGQGKLWVTDFGLARLGAEAGLTMTGDVLGTLRYMSPEQALAKHGLVDHRTDVYALGATLYELLTLRPAYTGSDRQELLRQIAFEEPKPPRRLDRGIPADLETVALKALAKDPAERYATAQELADDLRRFLDDQPILARPPSLRQRAVRWGRRHRAAVRAGVALAGLATLAALVAVWLIGAARADAAWRIGAARADVADARRAAAEQGRTQAVEENARTEAQLCETLRLVNQMLRTRDRELANVVRNAKDEHRKQAEAALAYLEALPPDRTFRADTRRELARAYQEVGTIFGQMGTGPADQATTRRTCGQALALFHALEAEDPAGAVAYRRERASVYVTLVWSYAEPPIRQWSDPIIKPLARLDMWLPKMGNGNGHQRFLAAMAHAELGEADKAREWYDKGVGWMNAHGPADADLQRFHAEAAALLGVEQKKD